MTGPSPAFPDPTESDLAIRCPGRAPPQVKGPGALQLLSPYGPHGADPRSRDWFCDGWSQQRPAAGGGRGRGEEEPLCPSPWGSIWGSPLWPVIEPGETQGSLSWSPLWLSLFTGSALGTCFREQCACWEPGQQASFGLSALQPLSQAPSLLCFSHFFPDYPRRQRRIQVHVGDHPAGTEAHHKI